MVLLEFEGGTFIFSLVQVSPPLRPVLILRIDDFTKVHEPSPVIAVPMSKFHVTSAPLHTWREVHSGLSSVQHDQNWIDICLLSTWILKCNKEHTGVCHHLPASHNISPNPGLMMIDVQQDCLVRMKSYPSYVALSYVWGRSPSLATTKENFTDLCKPRSLKEVRGTPGLPATIRDAMTLIRALGLRYLWVDRLCIIQDDEASIKHNISSMNSIYAEAYITVVASGGIDAQQGLPGVPGGSKALQHPQSVLKFGSACNLVIGSGDRRNFRERRFHKYDRRGWTFQEEPLSRRRLIFQDEQVIWFCVEMSNAVGLDSFAISGYDKTRPDTNKTTGPSLVPDARLPNILIYVGLVSGYTERVLTFPEDRLRAFSGILGALCDQFQSGFHYGLPEDCLDLALLWTTHPRSEGTQRITHLPSWSWVGWTGDIRIQSLKEIQSFHRSGDPPSFGSARHRISLPLYSSARTHGVTDFHKRSVESQTMSRVSNAFYEWRRISEDISAILPDGWHRERRPLHKEEPPPDQEPAEDLFINMFWHDGQPSLLHQFPIPLIDSSQRRFIADFFLGAISVLQSSTEPLLHQIPASEQHVLGRHILVRQPQRSQPSRRPSYLRIFRPS